MIRGLFQEAGLTNSEPLNSELSVPEQLIRLCSINSDYVQSELNMCMVNEKETAVYSNIVEFYSVETINSSFTRIHCP